MDLKSIEKAIGEFKMVEITLDSVLQFKNLSNKISIEEKRLLWENFPYNVSLLKLSEHGIVIDKELYDTNDYPKNIIMTIREKVSSVLKIETDDNKKENLNMLLANLSNMYIVYEDAQDELQNETNYLFEMIDEKFSWLDEDEEFILIAELLEKVSKEVCAKIQAHIEEKRKFYVDYIETTYKLNSGQDISFWSKNYVGNYIKSYILKNFGGMFDQVCLDVLDANGIKDESDIKKVISLYYDYTKQMIKIYFALNAIDMRTEMYEQHINSNKCKESSNK
jgi:hypothetical protein